MGTTPGDNSTFRNALRRTIDKLLDRALPKPKNPPRGENRAAAVGSSIAAAQKVAEAKIAAETRSAPFEAPTIPGTGRQWHVSNIKENVDLGQQRLLATKEARRGRVFSLTGPSPTSYEQTQALTLPYIARLRSQVQRSGWLLEKADLDSRLLREDYQLQQADRSRRAAFYKARHVLSPRDGSKLAYLTCNAVAAIIDDIDGFQTSFANFGVANGSGIAMQDVVYKPVKIRVVTGKNQSFMLDCEGIHGLYPIPNRALVYDIDTDDSPYVLQGSYNPVNPLYLPGEQDKGIPDEPLNKVVYHRSFGDGPPRRRGYMEAAHTLCYLKALSIDKLGCMVEEFSLPTPYLQNPENPNLTDEDLDASHEALEDLGKGKPATIPATMGEVKFTPSPQTFLPIHQIAISIIDAALSKLITSQTLAMESNGVGSFALGNVHAEQQADVQAIDLNLAADTERQQLVRYILDFNAETWARAFAPYCPGEECSPDAIRACLPRVRWALNRSVDPPARLKMFVDAKQEGLLISEDQVYSECDFVRAGDSESAFGAKPDPTPEPGQEPAAAPPTSDVEGT